MHICVSKLTIIGSDNGWNIVTWTLGIQFQWHFNQNSYIFIHENATENVVLKIAVKITAWISDYKVFQRNINILSSFLFNILTIQSTKFATPTSQFREYKLWLMFYLCSSQAEYNTEYIVLYYQGNPLCTGTTKGIKSIKGWLIHGKMGHNISR